MKIVPNNLREIKNRQRMQKLAGINECECSQNLNEMDPSTQGAIGMAVGGTVTLAAALKDIVAAYKKSKQSNPQSSTSDLIKQALSTVANSIQNSK